MSENIVPQEEKSKPPEYFENFFRSLRAVFAPDSSPEKHWSRRLDETNQAELPPFFSNILSDIEELAEQFPEYREILSTLRDDLEDVGQTMPLTNESEDNPALQAAFSEIIERTWIWINSFSPDTPKKLSDDLHEILDSFE